MFAHVLDKFALFWFIFCWLGYSMFARHRAKRTYCLMSVLHLYRVDWMSRLLRRVNRIADTSIVANLERNVTFFASSSILILAGILTVMSAVENTYVLLAGIPFAVESTTQQVQFKLSVLTIIFVFAFFKFTWSMRQYGFLSVLIGGAPDAGEADVTEQQREDFSTYAARVADLAAMEFNIGLRAYYFGLAVLGWFINPWLFIICSAWVVAILFRREFHSKTLKALMYSHGLNEN